MRAEADLGPSGATDPLRRSQPPRLRLILLILGALVTVSAAFAVLDAWRAAGELRTGRAAFRSLADRGLAAHGRLHAQARAATAHLAAADRRVRGSFWLTLWGRVPVLGRPARWLRAATGAAAALAQSATESVGRIEPGLASVRDPHARLAFLGLVEREFSVMLRGIDAVRLPGAGGLLPPVNAASRELTNELRELHDGLSRGIASVRGLRAFLAGPSTYLVLAANNAEMRAGGMVLQVGGLHVQDASMLAGGFRSAGELRLTNPVPLPSEVEALYGWLDPGVEWRNVGSSPNFPLVAPVYASMAKRKGARKIDGVLQLDVIGLRELLRVVGPVQIDKTRFDASNIDRLVMHDLYATFGSQQIERRAEFSRLAVATFAALNERPWRPAEIVHALSSAAAGRHLLVWSSHAEQMAAWSSLGVDGSLPRDGFMLTVQNHTGNKLDWFVRASMDIRVEKRSGEWDRVHASIRIHNRTPRGEPPYVAGDGSIVPPGDHRAMVAVYLPGWATNVEIPGRVVNLVGPDGRMRVIGTRIDVPRGGVANIEVVFSVPPHVHRLILLPSARAQPVSVRAGRWRLDDARPRVIPI